MKTSILPAILRKNVYLMLGILAGILLTLSKIHQNININPDAVYYLRAAHAYGVGGLQQAMAVYPWPFYSLLISGLHQVTGLSILGSAYTLNIFFQSVMLVGFWCLVSELSGFYYIDRKKLQCATVIVFLIFPNLNEYRHYIIRDFAYWGAFFFALCCLMRFSLRKQGHFAILWGALALLASSFRIEGLLLTLALPIILLFDGERSLGEKAKDFLLAQSVVIVFGVIVFAILTVHVAHSGQSKAWLAAHLGRLYECFKALTDPFKLMQHKHHHFVRVLSNDVLTVHAQSNAATIFFYGLLGLYFTKLVQYITLLYCMLAMYAFKQRLLPCREKITYILYAFILLNSLITLYFIYTHYFISGRYLLLLAFAIMLWVPFGLLHIYHQWESRAPVFTGQWWLMPMISLWLLYSTLSGLVTMGHKHHYIHRAGHWLQKATPSHAEVYSNDQRVLYYARGPVSTWDRDMDVNNQLMVIKKGDWKTYDYLAIRVRHGERGRERWILEKIGTAPVKIFANHDGDKVLIFKVP